MTIEIAMKNNNIMIKNREKLAKKMQLLKNI